MKPILQQVWFTKEDLGSIEGCFVCSIEDRVDDEGDKVVIITLFRPSDGRHIQMEIGDHGLIFITQPYAGNDCQMGCMSDMGRRRKEPTC